MPATSSNEKTGNTSLKAGDIDVKCQTERIVKTIAFSNFDALFQLKKKGDVLRTALSTTPLFQDFTLFLDLYPQGDSQATDAHSSVYVSYAGRGDLLLKFSVKMRAERADGTKINTVTNSNELECWRLLTTEEDGWGWKNFVDVARIQKAETLFLDLTVLICHTDFKPSEIEKPSETIASNALSSDFANLLSSGEGSDCTLFVGEERKRIACHSSILGARSSVFNAMLNSQFKEGKDKAVELPDCDYETMNHFLKFVYSGKMAEKLDMENYLALLDLGAKYSVETLLEAVGNQLTLLLNTENCISLLRVADLHNLKHLKDRAAHCATRDGLTLSSVQKHEDFQSLDADCMRALLGAAAPPQRDEPPSKKQRTS